MSDGRISQGEIIETSVPQEVMDLNAKLQELLTTFKDLKSASSTIEIKIGDSSGLKELMSILKDTGQAGKTFQDQKKIITELSLAVAEYNKTLSSTAQINAKLSVATSEEVKNYYAAKVALQEKNKELLTSAKNAAANTQASQQEITSLYNTVKGIQDAAAAYRVEATEKAALAASTTDLTAKSQLETQVLVANTNAVREEVAIKNALKEANKNVAAEVAKTLSIEAQAEAQTKKNITAANAQSAQDAKLEAGLERLNGAYAKLQAAYSIAALKAKDLGAASLLDSRVTVEYKNASKAAQELQNQLLAIDANVGQHTRNVGNYKSAYNGLSASVNQLTRELPALAINPSTFFLAISNNLPIFSDEINKIRNAMKLAKAESDALSIAAARHAEQAAIDSGATQAQAKAAGKLAGAMAVATTEQLAAAAAARLSAEGTAMAMGATLAAAKAQGDLAAATSLANAQQAKTPGLAAKLSAAFFSWQTLMSVGIALLTVYGGRIVDFFKGADSASKAAEKANKKYAESIVSIEESSRNTAQQDITRISVLTKLAASEDQSNRTRMRSIKELQETYPSTFGNLSKQAILEGQLGDAVNTTTKALLQRATYQAAEKKVAAAAEKAYDLTLAQRKATDELREAEAKRNSSSIGRDAEERGLNEFNAIDRAIRAKSTLDKISKDLAQINKEQNQYLVDAQTAAAAAGDVLFGKDPKTPKGRTTKGFDPTNAELKGQEDLNAAINSFAKQRVETDMASNKAIFDNETISLAQRLDAYEEYVKGQTQLTYIAENGEFEVIQEKLNKITEIEAISADKRTSAQKTLLLDKEALETKEKTLLEKFTLERQEVLSAAQKKEREIVSSSIQFQVKAQNQAFASIRDEVSKETAFRLSELNKQRENGVIGEKNYWSLRQNILASESQLYFNKQVEFLKKSKQEVLSQLADQNLPPEVKKVFEALKLTIDKEFGDLENMRPNPPKREEKTILEYLGLSKTQETSDIEEAKSIVDLRAKEYSDALINASYKLENAKVEAAEKFGEGSAEYAAAILSAENESNAAIEQASATSTAAVNNYIEKKKGLNERAKQEIGKLISELGKSIIDAYSAIESAGFQAEIDQSNARSQLIQDRLKEELDANESSLKSAKEKADEEKRLTKEAAILEASEAQKRRKIAHDEAVAKKRLAMFEVAINTALSISKVIVAYAATPPLAAIMAGLIAAMAGIQLATIAAQPVPAYWKGTDNHPGGPAKIGERGTELGILPSGRMFLTPSTETIVDLPAGTQIIPHHKLANATENMSNFELRNLQSQKSGKDLMFMPGQIEAALKKNAAQIVSAITNKEELKFHWSNGELRKSVKTGNVWTEYVGGVI